MKKRFCILLLVIFIMQFSFAGSVTLAKKTPTTLLSDDFQKYTPAKPWTMAKGWSRVMEGGSWAIADIKKNKYLQYFGAGNSDGSESEGRIINGNDNWTDMTVSVRVKLNGARYAGISRVKNGGDTYDVFIVNTSNIAFVRRATPIDTTVASAGYLIKPDTFYTLKVVFSGSKVSIFMNNSAKPIINIDTNVAEEGHKPSGKVGIYSQALSDKDSATFDNLVVTTP